MKKRIVTQTSACVDLLADNDIDIHHRGQASPTKPFIPLLQQNECVYAGKLTKNRRLTPLLLPHEYAFMFLLFLGFFFRRHAKYEQHETVQSSWDASDNLTVYNISYFSLFFKQNQLIDVQTLLKPSRVDNNLPESFRSPTCR